jgi:two-component system, chemotaxis family, CheB/CheR fusion protein
MENVKCPGVVAIGASAGGLNAFRKLIENLPTDTGMAFVLLTHILRGSISLLPEILSHSTKMRVSQVTKDVQPRSNHIYVLPPDKFMEMRDGALHLVPRPNDPINSAIDHFHVYKSVGIILSGTSADGSEGIKILKSEGGGVTMAQSPESAKSDSMPINAIHVNHVDYILSPKHIAEKLASMSRLDQDDDSLKVIWMTDSKAA